MLVVLATGDPQQLSWRYVRLVATIVLALTVGTSLWIISTLDVSLKGTTGLPAWAGLAAAAGAAALIALAPVAARRLLAYRSTAIIAGTSAVAAALGVTWLRLEATLVPSLSSTAVFMIVVGQTLGALLLGGITVSWLLGHAYLTATKMTIEPLRRFSRVLAAAVLARAAFFLLSVALAWALVGPAAGAPGSTVPFIDLVYRSWLIVFLRVGLGIVGVGIFAFMVLDCVRLRSTQSTTGILYFGSIFAYIGELASLYLLYQWGWPI